MKEKIEKFSLKQQIYWNIQCKILCDTLHQQPLRAHRHRHTRCLSVWREHRSLLPLFLIWLMIFIRNAGFGLHISGYWDWNSIQTHKLAPLYIIRIKSSYISKPYIVWALPWLLLLWRTRRMIHGPCFDGCVLLLTKSVDLLPSILINYSVKCPVNNRRNANQ